MNLPLCGVVSVALLLTPVFTQAQSPLTGPLQYGMVDNAQVVLLQQFLKDEGFFTGAVTGNFFTLTQSAVKQFQASVGVESTGYFGPLSTLAANTIIEAEARGASPALTTPKTTLKADTLTRRKNNQSASILSAFTADEMTLTWQTNNYPIGVGIDINLLRQISDTPVQYEFIRTIATNASNDRSHSWKPLTGEKDSDLYVEITCSASRQFINGCSVGG